MGKGPEVWPPASHHQLHLAPASFYRGYHTLPGFWLDKGYWSEEGPAHRRALWRTDAGDYRTAAGAVKRGERDKREGPRADC